MGWTRRLYATHDDNPNQPASTHAETERETAMPTSITNVFEDLKPEAYPFEYEISLHLDAICGGVPSDPNIAEGWIRTKLGGKMDEEQIQRLVAETMLDRGISQDDAIAEINKLKHLNGFKRHPELGIYIEGRQLKAAIKEAVSVAAATPEVEGLGKKLDLRGWGDTKKYLTNYLPEHIFVVQDRLYLENAATGEPFHEPTTVIQTFPKNQRVHQTGIQYTQVCEDVLVHATIITDHPFSRHEFGMIWLTGGQQGLGAQRSQMFGRYDVVRWDQTRGPVVTKKHSNKPPRSAAAAKPAAEDEADD